METIKIWIIDFWEHFGIREADAIIEKDAKGRKVARLVAPDGNPSSSLERDCYGAQLYGKTYEEALAKVNKKKRHAIEILQHKIANLQSEIDCLNERDLTPKPFFRN